MHEALGDGNLAQPSTERRFRAKSRQALIESHHRVLEHILGLHPATQQTPNERKGRRSNGRIDLRLRMLIAAARPRHNLRRDPDLNELGHRLYRCAAAEKGRRRRDIVSATLPRALTSGKANVENPPMKALVKLLILATLGTALTGCVVAPVGPRVRAYVAVPAPVMVVRPYGYYGPR